MPQKVSSICGLMGRARRKCFAVLVLVFFGSVPIWGQGTIQDQLNSTYKGKILLLRNFYSGNDLRYDQNGRLLGTATSGSWTVANIQIRHVSVTSQGIELTGKRFGRLYNGVKHGLIEVGKVRIYLELPRAEPAERTDVDSLMGKIFVMQGEDLRPMLPDCWRYYLTGTDKASRMSTWEAALNDIQKPLKLPGEKLTAPKPVSTPVPKYTKEAESERIEGLTVLRMVVNATGTPESIAILDPLGMGLDEQAVATVAHWRFSPATLMGQPVPVQMSVETMFRCCQTSPPPK